MVEGKQKFSLWLTPEAKHLVEKLYSELHCKSQSEFIEKAIYFYSGFVGSKDYKYYLPEVVVSTIQSTIHSYEDRSARLLFKIAVELSLLNHIIASTNCIEPNSVDKVRKMCIDDVKSINGIVDLKDAVEFQRGE